MKNVQFSATRNLIKLTFIYHYYLFFFFLFKYNFGRGKKINFFNENRIV